jgi:hypothetical protein
MIMTTHGINLTLARVYADDKLLLGNHRELMQIALNHRHILHKIVHIALKRLANESVHPDMELNEAELMELL